MGATEPAEEVVKTAERQGESLLAGELLLYVERYHDDDEPGVSDDLVEAYVERLAERGFFPRGPETLLPAISEKRTDSDTWVGEDAFYTVGEDRVSSYPLQWHESLGPDDDIRSFVEVLHEDIETANEQTDRGGTGSGVPKQLLVDAATVIGGYDRQEALDELQHWRDEGDLFIDADQHREGRVQLAQ